MRSLAAFVLVSGLALGERRQECRGLFACRGWSPRTAKELGWRQGSAQLAAALEGANRCRLPARRPRAACGQPVCSLHLACLPTHKVLAAAFYCLKTVAAQGGPNRLQTCIPLGGPMIAGVRCAR